MARPRTPAPPEPEDTLWYPDAELSYPRRRDGSGDMSPPYKLMAAGSINLNCPHHSNLPDSREKFFMVLTVLIANAVCQHILQPHLATLFLVPMTFILYLKKVVRGWLTVTVMTLLLAVMLRLNTDTAAIVALHCCFYGAVMIKHNYMYGRENGPPCT